MGMIWFRETFEIHVENPGYGELYLASSDFEKEGRTLAGEELGQLLTAWTHYALTGDRPETHADLIPGDVTAEEARKALPVVQRAVLLSAAGTDRCERIDPDPDPDASPAPPLCETCNHGTDYSSDETHSTWCDEYGHAPFGYPAGTSWAQAQQRHEWAVQSHQLHQRIIALDADNHRPQPSEEAES